MKRVPLLKFKGPIEGYVVNYLRVNMWRVEGIEERDDLLQEAELIFLKLKQKYQIENNAHMMALFKVSWENAFNKLANKRTRQRTYEGGPVEEEDVSNPSAFDLNEGHLLCLIDQAPEEVRSVLTFLMGAPKELLDEVTKAWRSKGRRSAEGSKHLSELLGYSSDTDLIESVRDYLN